MSKNWMHQTASAIRTLEREAERRSREAAKREKLRLKAELQATAVKAVETYKEVIATLTSAHKEPVETIDWNDILNEPAPPEPEPTHTHEKAASTKLDKYRPSGFDKLFGLTGRKTRRLEKALVAAKEKDRQLSTKAHNKWTAQTTEWEKMHRLAERILLKDTVAYGEAIALFHHHPEGAEGAAPPVYHFHSQYIEIEWCAQTETAVPNFTLTLTQAGKLSKKDMAVSKFHELYQDHICSWLLHAAHETLALLPVEFVIVHMLSDLLDQATGRTATQPILSALIYPENLRDLNFAQLDPSEALKNFKHNIQFSKTTGFKPVEKLDPAVFIGQ